MEDCSHYDPQHHWGNKEIELSRWDLPALKARFLLEHLPSAGRVLEIGCGGGKLLNTIATHRPKLELYGSDIRPLRYEPQRFAFEVVDIDDPTLPFDPESFDSVLMVDVLEHFTDPSMALRAARRVLRSEGTLISFTPLQGQRFSFYRMFRRIFGDDLYLRTEEHIHAFSEADLRALIEPDFHIVEHQYAYHFLGHLMDASLFALLAIPSVRRRFWSENPFYEEVGEVDRDSRRSALSAVLRAANVLAFLESRALRRVSLSAAGYLFVATRR